MDVREKLIEIVKKAAYSSLPSNTEDFHLNMFVTNLLSHGVTVQSDNDINATSKWISVDERLPENFISVLGYMTDAGEFPPVRECYTVGNVFFFPALGDIHPVSHWREMPDPPKGE